ncbi:MAG: cytidine deaminase [Flavobacteriales bacterium]
MAQERTLTFHYLEHADAAALGAPAQRLVEAAADASTRAYAPYSKFHVGAALRLSGGAVVTGNNQENASFPAGICAERTALHAALSQDPTAMVVEMAIAVPAAPADRPVSPCGICRQALLEQEHRQGAPIRIYLASAGGKVIELERAGDLLPLSFDASFLGA